MADVPMLKQIRHKDLVIDTDAKKATVNGKVLKLTVLEYEIVFLLMSSPKKVFKRLQREQRELKAPQERSNEEIEAVPAERVCLERKSTASNRKMRVWERNRSHTRIDVPKRTFSVPSKTQPFFLLIIN